MVAQLREEMGILGKLLLGVLSQFFEDCDLLNIRFLGDLVLNGEETFLGQAFGDRDIEGRHLAGQRNLIVSLLLLEKSDNFIFSLEEIQTFVISLDCGIFCLADGVGDFFDLILEFEGRLRSVDELFDHLRVDVASSLPRDVDSESGSLLVQNVFFLSDQLQDPDQLLLTQLFDISLFDAVLDEEGSD